MSAPQPQAKVYPTGGFQAAAFPGSAPGGAPGPSMGVGMSGSSLGGGMPFPSAAGLPPFPTGANTSSSGGLPPLPTSTAWQPPAPAGATPSFPQPQAARASGADLASSAPYVRAGAATRTPSPQTKTGALGPDPNAAGAALGSPHPAQQLALSTTGIPLGVGGGAAGLGLGAGAGATTPGGTALSSGAGAGAATSDGQSQQHQQAYDPAYELRRTRGESYAHANIFSRYMRIAVLTSAAAAVVALLFVGLPALYLVFVLGTCGAAAIVTDKMMSWSLMHDAHLPEMRKVAGAIREGSEAYIATQYGAVGNFAIRMALIVAALYYFKHNPYEEKISVGFFSLSMGVSFVLGAFCSGLAGLVGMWVSIRINLRVAVAASQGSYTSALLLCFRGGAVSAAISAGLCILGISLLYIVNYIVFVLMLGLPASDVPVLLAGYGFGAAFVALFMQLGGGIYTKGADVGADMCGKIEIGLPEDDCRNPAVVADLVGDNVGDCAGSMADIFESISSEIIGAMILASSLCSEAQVGESVSLSFIFFPLVVHALDLIVSGAGIFAMNVRPAVGSAAAAARGGNGGPSSSPAARVQDIIAGFKSVMSPPVSVAAAQIDAAGGGGAASPLGYSSSGAAAGGASAGQGFDLETGRLLDGASSGSASAGGAVGGLVSGSLASVYEPDQDPIVPMQRGYFISTSLAVVLMFVTARVMLYTEKAPSAWLYFALCGLVGIATSYLLTAITQYYTDYHYAPVKRIVAASATGHGTNVIAGVSVGMESCFLPALTICTALLITFNLGYNSGLPGAKAGVFGCAVCTMGMLSTAVYILSMNNFGPIADNAGGIVEMSEQPAAVRSITDRLDAVGNVTKASSKGYAVGGSALASFVLFQAFLDEISVVLGSAFASVNLARVECIAAGMMGVAMIFLFAGWSMESVGTTAQAVVWEVRQQLEARPGILNFTAKPDYAQCVSIVTASSLKEMRKPAIMALTTPIAVGVVFRLIGMYRGDNLLAVEALASFMLFATMSGLIMAIFLDNAGGAWDNAKKSIESTGRKGSPEHKAAVTGDTVGDPFKDTAGPSLHVILTTVSTTILVLGPLFVGSKV